MIRSGGCTICLWIIERRLQISYIYRYIFFSWDRVGLSFAFLHWRYWSISYFLFIAEDFCLQIEKCWLKFSQGATFWQSVWTVYTVKFRTISWVPWFSDCIEYWRVTLFVFCWNLPLRSRHRRLQQCWRSIFRMLWEWWERLLFVMPYSTNLPLHYVDMPLSLLKRQSLMFGHLHANSGLLLALMPRKAYELADNSHGTRCRYCWRWEDAVKPLPTLPVEKSYKIAFL